MSARGSRLCADLPTVRGLTSHMKNARIEVIPHACLIGWIDQPDMVSELIIGFTGSS